MDQWDVIVVGGGAAGLSGALVLGRARRRTLMIDAGSPSNLPAHGIGGLLGHDGQPPAELYATGRKELSAYPTVEVRPGEVVGGRRDGETFVLDLDDGRQETARRVLLAMGTDYRYPDIPGIAERWGNSVFHCPFCHGWEVRERTLGVLGGLLDTHRVLLLRMWSDDVTLYTNGPADLDPDEAEQIRAAGVAVDERPVAGLRGPGRELTAVAFADGSERACHGLMVPVTLHQRSGLAAQLGAATTETSPAQADGIEVDPMQQTTVPGLYAAGDAGPRGMPSVANAIATGQIAAASIVQSLLPGK